MITKGPFQPREPTAKEVDELQAYANMMFFYKGRQNIVLNTNPTFHPTEYYPSQYDIDMHDQCRRRQEAWWQRSHHAQLRGREPTGNCYRKMIEAIRPSNLGQQQRAPDSMGANGPVTPRCPPVTVNQH